VPTFAWPRWPESSGTSLSLRRCCQVLGILHWKGGGCHVLVVGRAVSFGALWFVVVGTHIGRQ